MKIRILGTDNLLSGPEIFDMIKLCREHGDSRILSHQIILGAFLNQMGIKHNYRDIWLRGKNSIDNMCLITVKKKDRLISIGGVLKSDNVVMNSFTVTHNDYRRLGIGTKVMMKKIEWGRKHKAKRFITTAGKTNNKTIGMIEKIGFTRYGDGFAPNGNRIIKYQFNL